MFINKINSQNSSLIYKKTFKSKSKEERIKEFQAEQAKRNYIESKTETIEDLVDVTFISSLFLGAQNISFSKKLTKKEWFALGMLITACASMITLFIKKAQYAKEYEKEMNK